jgi:homeodomain-containing protein
MGADMELARVRGQETLTMPNKKYIVDLTEAERNELLALTTKGTVRARKMKRAQILLKADVGFTDAEIMAALEVSRPYVERVRQRFVEGGLPEALNEGPRLGQRRKLDGKQEARLIAEVCSAAPAGHARWTLRLLAGRVVELKLADKISPETVRQVLKKNELKPWQTKEWCIPEVSADFVAAMEDVLDLYAEPYDPKRPKVCFDETPKQLIAETRVPSPAQPGQVERYGSSCSSRHARRKRR